MKILNLFAGPGTGKSTIAAGLFYKMKMLHHNVELATEYAKDLTYEERTNILTTDQLYVLAKQHRRIHRLLNKTDYIISDSPLLMTWIYFSKDNNIYDPIIFKNLLLNIHEKYDTVNIYLNRNPNLEYKNEGRIQTLEESKIIDVKILKLLNENNVEYDIVDVNDNSINVIYDKLISKE